MANTFIRYPVAGGDTNVWATYLLAQLDTGKLTTKLYNNAGALTCPVGKIGIDNGTTKGVCDIDTVTAISLAGGSNSTWLAIEAAVAGTAVTFSATDIAGASDPTIIPASVRAAWDGAKGGYYLTATKRLVGLAWKNAGGVLLAVVNFDGQKIWASQIGLHTGTIHSQVEPGKGFVIETGAWNMDTTASINVSHAFGVFRNALGNITCIIRDDTSFNFWKLEGSNFDAADPNLANGGFFWLQATLFALGRRTGSTYFDNGASMASVAITRGWVTVHLREF